jgi:septal ring factor EnvC (AmiA/AmiB activator)
LTCRTAGLLLIAALAAGVEDLEAEQPKQDELRDLRQRIERLKEELDAAAGTRAQAADALRESETAISAANRRLRGLAGERDLLQAELGRITAEARALRADLDGREGQFARLLQARYVEGDRSFLRTLLSGDDPHHIARNLIYLTYVSRAQAQVIQRMRDDLTRLSGLDVAAREKSAALIAMEAKARSERDALRAKSAEHRQVLAAIAEQILKGRKDLAQAQQNEGRLARIVQELERASRSPSRGGGTRPDRDEIPVVGAFGSLKGRLRLPVRGELSARYGSPQQSVSPSRKGIFIRAAEGTPVRAVAAGRIAFADWMRGYGNLLILDHGDGYLSIYGNNESVFHQVGDAVHAGDVVATVGATGGNDTSGLYFELRHQGKPFDPVPWLQSK